MSGESPRDAVVRQFAQAMAAKDDLAKLRAQGVRCTQCGATVPLPDDVTQAQFACRFCGAMLATQQYVAPQLIAGAQMRAHLTQMRGEARRVSRSRDVAILVGAGVLALVIAAAVLVPTLLARGH